MGLIPGLEGVNFSTMAIFTKIIYYVGIFLLVALICGVLFFVYYLTKFKIKAIVFPLVASGTVGSLGVGARKFNRFCWNKEKTAWRSLKPLFNKKDIEPFSAECIYANKTVCAFELPDGQFIPGNINISRAETQKLSAEINPIPKYLLRYEEVGMKQDEIRLAEGGFWEKNKGFITVLVVGLICLVMVLGTVYFITQMVQPSTSAVEKLTSAIANNNVIPSVTR